MDADGSEEELPEQHIPYEQRFEPKGDDVRAERKEGRTKQGGQDGGDTSIDDDAKPRSRSSSVIRGRAPNDEDEEQSEWKVLNKSTPCEQSFEPERDGSRSEILEEKPIKSILCPSKCPHSCIRKKVRFDLDGDRSEDVIMSSADGDESGEEDSDEHVPYEQRFEPRGGDVRSEFRAEKLKQSHGKRKREELEDYSTGPNNDMKEQKVCEDFAQDVKGDEEKEIEEDGKDEQFYDAQDELEHKFEDEPDGLPPFGEMEWQRNRGFRRPRAAPAYVASDQVPPTRLRPEYNHVLQPDPDQRKPQREKEKVSDRHDTPGNGEEEEQSSDLENEFSDESEAEPHNGPTENNPQRPMSSPMLDEDPLGNESQDQNAHSAPGPGSKPPPLPIFEQMMEEASSAPKRGASDPLPSSPPRSKRPRFTSRSTSVPDASVPEFIPIYEEMLRNTAGKRTYQGPEPSPLPSSSGPSRVVPGPLLSSPPKLKQSKPALDYTASKAALQNYIKAWDSLARHEQGWPYPNPDLTESGLLSKSSIHLTAKELSNLSDTTIISLNTQTFFLKAHGVVFNPIAVESKAKIVISSFKNDVEQVRSLRGYLKKKELTRWHPDRINLRTGVEGGEPDGMIGLLEIVVAVRTGVDELIERCEEAVLKSEKYEGRW